MWPNGVDSLGWSARIICMHQEDASQDALRLFGYVYHLDQVRKTAGQASGDHSPLDAYNSADFDNAPHRGREHRGQHLRSRKAAVVARASKHVSMRRPRIPAVGTI
jgi:hypothetical protein